MITFDEVGAMLDDIAGELPPDLYKELNGGINLLPDAKVHPESNKRDDLYILGEYYNEPQGLGRYIVIYFGSFISLYGHLKHENQKRELRRILLHEFTHHLESLAGERELEIKDVDNLLKYKHKFGHGQ